MRIDLMMYQAQALRVLARAERAGERHRYGRELRTDKRRLTQDGVFLGALVDAGLLTATGVSDDPMQRTYALTPAGRFAADYLWYAADVVRDEKGKIAGYMAYPVQMDPDAAPKKKKLKPAKVASGQEDDR